MVQRSNVRANRGKSRKSQRIDLADIFNKLISNGHNINDVKNNYTTEQVYTFYERCLKDDMRRQQLDAIILYNSLLCTSQTDKKGVVEQKKHWKKFIDSFDWDKATAEKKVDPLKAFGSLGKFITIRGVK